MGEITRQALLDAINGVQRDGYGQSTRGAHTIRQEVGSDRWRAVLGGQRDPGRVVSVVRPPVPRDDPNGPLADQGSARFRGTGVDVLGLEDVRARAWRVAELPDCKEWSVSFALQPTPNRELTACAEFQLVEYREWRPLNDLGGSPRWACEVHGLEDITFVLFEKEARDACRRATFLFVQVLWQFGIQGAALVEDGGKIQQSVARNVYGFSWLDSRMGLVPLQQFLEPLSGGGLGGKDRPDVPRISPDEIIQFNQFERQKIETVFQPFPGR